MPSCKTFIITGIQPYTPHGHLHMAFIALIILALVAVFWIVVGVGYVIFFLTRFCYEAFRNALGFSPEDRFTRRFKAGYLHMLESTGRLLPADDVLDSITAIAYLDHANVQDAQKQVADWHVTRRDLLNRDISLDHPDFVTLKWIRVYYARVRRPHPTIRYHIEKWRRDRQPTDYNTKHYEESERFYTALLQFDTAWSNQVAGVLPEVPKLPYLSQMQLGFG